MLPLLWNSTISPMGADATPVPPCQACGSVTTLELAMVPGDNAVDVDDDAGALGPGPLKEGHHLVGPLADVSLEHAATDGHLPVVVGHQLGPAHQLDAPELLVGVARLDERGDLRVALEVADLLRLAERPERRRLVDEAVPHGNHVDGAVVVERRHIHGVATVEELHDRVARAGDGEEPVRPGRTGLHHQDPRRRRTLDRSRRDVGVVGVVGVVAVVAAMVGSVVGLRARVVPQRGGMFRLDHVEIITHASQVVGELGPAGGVGDHRDPCPFRQLQPQVDGRRVVVELECDGPCLGAGVVGGEQASTGPPQRPGGGVAVDEPAARCEQPHRVERQRPEHGRGLGREQRLLDSPGPRHRPQPFDRVHPSDRSAGQPGSGRTRGVPGGSKSVSRNRVLLPSPAVATNPPGDLELAPLDGEPRTLDAWLTTFHLAAVVLDPYTYESAWLLPTAGRILEDFRGADCRIAFVVTADADDTREFLGPWATRVLTFAEGWDPPEWRQAVSELAKAMSWTRPNIPGPGDPKPYAGSPALGA